MAQDLTARVQVLGQNPDGSLNVQMTGGNPFNPATVGAAQTNALQMGGGMQYALKIGGQVVNFASEADMLKAQMVMMQQQSVGGSNPMFGMQQQGSMASWLPLAANAASAVNHYFQGTKLDRKVKDLQKALAAQREARSRLETYRSAYPDIIPALLDLADAERASTESALALAEDLLSANGVAVGVDVAKVAADYLTSNTTGPGLLSGGNSSLPLLAAGAIGVGLLTSRSSNK